jgi:hypothetical protein
LFGKILPLCEDLASLCPKRTGTGNILPLSVLLLPESAAGSDYGNLLPV